jgi:hypothetical protein
MTWVFTKWKVLGMGKENEEDDKKIVRKRNNRK